MPAVLYRGGVTLSEINSFPNQIAQMRIPAKATSPPTAVRGCFSPPIQKPRPMRINPMPETRDTHHSPRGIAPSQCGPRLARTPFTTSQSPMSVPAASTGRSDCSNPTIPTTTAAWGIAAVIMAMMPITKLIRLKRGKQRSIRRCHASAGSISDRKERTLEMSLMSPQRAPTAKKQTEI
jgi:hypothetical protein